ncbi:MAG: hypothetical protein ACNA7Y_03965 [Gammaproteobacteria bacterium]
MNIMKHSFKSFKLIASIAALGLSISTNVYASCTLTAQNQMQNPYIEAQPFEMRSLRVADGSCEGGTCPSVLLKDDRVTFVSEYGKLSTVLTSSVYRKNTTGETNIGSFRIEIQNASSTCKPVHIYTDWCSTKPETGKADCKYVFENSQITVQKINS